MKLRYIKILFWSLVLSMTAGSVHAQSVSRTGYFMDNNTHKHLLNPALTSEKGYISIPVLGELSMGLETNLFLSNFLYPSANGGELMTFLHPDVSADEFLSKLDPVNYLRGELRTSLLSLGLNTKVGFITFDVASRVNLSMNLPYELFSFMKLGMASGQGNQYNIRDLSINAGGYAEVALGYSRKIMDNLSVGAKLKYLGGIANVKASLSKMDISMSQTEWSVSTDALVELYGKGFAFEKNEDQTVKLGKFGTPNGLGGSGFAIDLGVMYSPVKNLDVSVGIVDLGSITYKKENVKIMGAAGSVSFSGIDGIGIDSVAGKNIENQLNQLEEDAKKMYAFNEKPGTDSKQKLYTTINAGAQYKLLDNKIGAGLLYSARLMENETYSELMLSGTFRPAKWFQIGASYSFMHSDFKTFGLAMNISPGFANLFLACDYLILKRTPQFIPLNNMNTNIQLGLAIPLGK